MLPDGTYTGVVDRIEEDAEGVELAVILLEDDGEVIEQVNLPRGDLPAEVEPDTVLEVALVDGDVTDVAYLAEETETRADAAQRRFDRLAERPPDCTPTDPTSDTEE